MLGEVWFSNHNRRLNKVCMKLSMENIALSHRWLYRSRRLEHPTPGNGGSSFYRQVPGHQFFVYEQQLALEFY